MAEEEITITYPDGSTMCYPSGIRLLDILGDAKEVRGRTLAVKIDGKMVDLDSTLESSATLEFIALESVEGIDIYRHSTSHIMAQAVKELFKDVKLGIGPTIADGFYYDFDIPTPFTPDDLDAIEKRMREIIIRNIPFVREEVTRGAALKIFDDMEEFYKIEIIEQLQDDKVSIYRQGKFIDLCRGPHLPFTGWIKAFKLTGTAGAYWRGNEKNKMLQRIYGTSFPTRKDLKAHLKKLEEAKKRDHRKLGKELDLFSVEEEIGAGLVLWHPKGAVVRGIIEDFWKKEHYKAEYDIIYTPHIAKMDLWRTSGHLDFYRDSMYSPMDVEGLEYVVKPMNCPFHIKIYKGRLRSYRELPIRYAELGTVYRYERSGVLHGLLRVRGFTQDDAHIFCVPSQLDEEIKKVLNFTLYMLRSFGFNEYEVFLSTRPGKYVGTLEKWAQAESALKSALDDLNIPYVVDPGEGVFYGPKIDIKIKDTIGRAWQCSTIQVDFNLPERFNVTYRGDDGASHQPIMVHRALMGSLERFFGCLIEHYAGAFPLWLAPVQATLMTVTDRGNAYTEVVCNILKKEGFRVTVDARNEKLGLKIREAQLGKVPYMAIIGDKEVTSKTLSIRSREGAFMSPMSVEEFISLIQKENKSLGGEIL